MQLRHLASLTGLFAALCTTPAAAQTFSSLPGQGPLENKTCDYITGPPVRPGNVPVTPDQAAAKARAIASGWASIMGNDCKIRPYVVDAQGNATVQDDNAPARLMRERAAGPSTAQAPAQTAATPASVTPSAATVPSTATGWSTIPGFLPAQVDPASIRLTYVPMPSSAAWREEGCLINGIKVPIGAGLILDNRTIWRVGAKCALEPLVTVTRDAAQPLNGPATRFESANELMASLDGFISALAAKNSISNAVTPPGGASPVVPQLRGEAVPPFFPAGAFIQTYPGKAVVVDNSIALGLGLMKRLAGQSDDRLALLLPAPTATSTATALTGEWWHQPGLLATSPQGNITAAGRDAAGNCRIAINGQQVAATAPDRLIIPDNTRLMYVDSKCDVKLVFNVPAEKGAPEPPVTVTGGGFRNPGNIILPGKPNVNVLFQPPTGAEQTAARVIATLSALAATNPNAALAARALVIGPAVAYGSIAVLTLGAGYVIYKHIEEMNEKEAELAIRRTETPSGPYEKHLTRPIDERADALSNKKDTDGRIRGTCAEDMISDPIHDQQKNACNGARVCRSSMTASEVSEQLFKNGLCLKYRINLMDMCFAGGNDTHRNHAQNILKQLRSCQILTPK